MFLLYIASGGEPTRRRRRSLTLHFPARSTRRRTDGDRPMDPLESMQVTVNLSRFDFEQAVLQLQAQGSPMYVFLCRSVYLNN